MRGLQCLPYKNIIYGIGKIQASKYAKQLQKLWVMFEHYMPEQQNNKPEKLYSDQNKGGNDAK